MRRAIAATLAAFILVFVSAPAHGAIPSSEAVTGAEADWAWVQGNTAVDLHIRVVNDRVKDPGTPSERTVGINVQLVRVTTDPDTGASVTDFLMSEPYYADASVLTMHRLVDASVVATVTLVGTRWSDAGEASIGTYRITVNADWTASSDVTRDRSHSWSTEFGGWVSNQVAVQSALAVATASVTGDLPYGALAPAEGDLVVLRESTIGFETAGPMALAMNAVLADMPGGRINSHVLRAAAGWSVDDEFGTELWVTFEQPFDAREKAGGIQANVEVTQGFCDVATDESVVRILSGNGAATGSLANSMSTAEGMVPVSLNGVELRQPGCDGFGEAGWTVSEVRYDVAIQATWDAIGPVEFVRTSHIIRTADEWFRARMDGRGRQADASGVITGQFGDRAVTSVINAYLEDSHYTSAGEQPGS